MRVKIKEVKKWLDKDGRPKSQNPIKNYGVTVGGRRLPGAVCRAGPAVQRGGGVADKVTAPKIFFWFREKILGAGRLAGPRLLGGFKTQVGSKEQSSSDWLIRFARRLPRFWRVKLLKLAIFCRRHQLAVRFGSIVMVAIIVFSIGFEIFGTRSKVNLYDITLAEGKGLIRQSINLYEPYLTRDAKSGSLAFNQNYAPGAEVAGDSAMPGYKATFTASPTSSVTVTDPVSETSITLKPKFGVGEPQKNGNRVIYPIKGQRAAKVYSLFGSGVKEDIILYQKTKNELSYSYELQLPEGLEARQESDGSLGIYGVDSNLLGNVTTGSEQDAELLKKARQNSPKKQVLFKIPRPVVLDGYKDLSTATARFELNGNNLTVITSNLLDATYPLSIDPSIYVESAAKLMRGNNETNIDFDITNELIQKSPTTGARIDAWTDTTDMNNAVWDHSTAAAGGYVYRAGGRTGITMPEVVSVTETLDGTDGTSFTMNMPASRPAGDLYIAVFCHDGSSGANVTGPAGGGWTEYADLQGHAAYYKIGANISGGNEAASYQWTGPNETYAGVIIRVSGFDSADVVSGTITTGSSAVSVTPVFPAVTPDTDATLIIRAVGNDADTPSAGAWVPTGHTYLDSGSSGGTPCGYAAASVDTPPLSGVAQAAATFADTSVSDDYGASSIAINAAAVTPTVQTSVQWAQFDNTTGAISSSTNPGAGACSGWCTNSVYDLPGGRVGAAMTSYNGYLFVVGGTTDGTAANAQTNVWVAKLGANGEPSLWHPSGGTPAYWYVSSNTLPAANSYTQIHAYNNKLYLVGGRDTSGNALTAVRVADILPTGDIGAWSTSGMEDLTTPTARFGHSVHIYNDVMYIIGGNNSGTLRNTVFYSRLNSDGTMNPWTATSNFTTARTSMGGMMTGVWGAYIYLAGGCTALTSGYCSTVATDVQLVSINADGSLAEWNTILNLTNQRMSYNFIAWQNGLYRLGGCAAQNTSTGVCRNTYDDVEYGVINPEGESSTVASSVASGVAPCSGSAPYSCDLPSASVGNVLNASVIVNGYLYIMGGCTVNNCGTLSSGVTYQAIASDGTLQRPASCTGTYTDSFCVSSTSLPSARGAPGVAVFNSRIYLIGGFPTITNISHTLVNADGSIGAWTNTDFTVIAVDGIDDDLSYTFAYARANPANAGSVPGNLFIFGGCTNDTSGPACGDYSDSVYKCDLSTTGVPSNCTIAGQTQIGTVTGGSGDGLGAHAGAVYANYIYLMGGLAPGALDLDTVRYAKFDDNNNVVESDGVGTAAWTESATTILVGRRRGAGFGYNGYLYITGGYDGSDALADIEFAKINVSTGDIGTFVSSSVNINKRWGLTVPVSNSYAYVVGGCIAGPAPTGCTSRTNTIQTFQIYNNDSGAIKSVTSMTDDSFAANTDRWGASSAVLNGYIYVAGGCISATDCTDATNDVQYAPISTTDGSVGTWATTTNVLPLDRAWGQLKVAGGFLYYIGGQDDTATNEQSTVYYVGTFSSGNISAAWSTASGALGDVSTAGVQTAPRTKFGAAVWDNRIYVIGGLDGSAADTNTVYYSPKLASGGNIAADSWTLDSDSPDVSRFGAAVTAYANNLYQFGGNDGTNYLNDGQYASLGYKTGTISQSGTTVTGSGTSWTAAMIGSTLQYSDGSTATISTVPSGTSMTVSVNKTVTAGSIYVVLDGSVGVWTFTTSTPGAISQGEAFAANGYMYIVGGRSAATSCVPNTLIAPISANTTIATGNNPTGVGEWYETNTRYAGGRYGAALAYDKGKVYLMGGGCTSPQAGTYNTGTIGQATTTVTGTGTNWTDNYVGGIITYADASTATIVSVNSTTSLTVSVSKTVTAPQSYSIAVPRHSYGVLKSQPQVAKYSRMIDTDTDVFPNSWLVNGLDNSVGARWQARYRSMHDLDALVNPNEDCGTSATMAAMTGWGQETNYGDVIMGDVATYTPLNSSGGNIGCARYYFFSLSIDASQTYGYPEDVNRGPTIADLSLFFTSDPSKRLRHGKTFTGGEQQPLDTPCGQTVDPSCPNP
jgi:Kelch motif